MAFGEALRFPFRGEKRWVNLGFAALCFLIPIVGPIVLLGYGVLVEKKLIADIDAAAPDFDFSHFMAHLKRGVEPFVVGLILVPVIMVAILPVAGMLAWGVIRFDSHKDPVFLGCIVGFAALFAFVLIAISNLLITPVALKAELEKTIGGAFDWTFAVSFIRRVGWRTLGYNLLLMAISMLMMPFAFCFLFVGVYAATAWLIFVQLHIRAQLYRLYLERGGTPLNIRVDDQLTAFPPIMPDAAGMP